MDGWVKLHRSLIDSDVFRCLTDARFKVMIAALLLAGHKDTKIRNGGKFITLHAGEFLTSAKTLAERVGCDPHTAMKALDDLSELGFLERRSTRNGTIVSVKNWQKYQGFDEGGVLSNHTPSNTPTNTPSNTNQEYKEIKEYISIKEQLSKSLDPELKEALCNYIDMREEKHIPLTQTQFNVLLQNLVSMTFVVTEQIEIVNRATANGWKNFYKSSKREQSKKKSNIDDVLEAWMNE